MAAMIEDSEGRDEAEKARREAIVEEAGEQSTALTHKLLDSGLSQYDVRHIWQDLIFLADVMIRRGCIDINARIVDRQEIPF